jgi:hypothetical protein
LAQSAERLLSLRHWAGIIVTLVIGAAAFCALGVAVASLISNAEAAPAVVQFVFFPLVFISGTYFQITSRFLNDLAGVFPVRPFNQALLNPFALDRGFAGRQLLVLAIWGIAGGFVAIRRFRWDPRPERYQAAVRLTLMNPGRQLDRTAQAATRRQAHGHASSPGPQPPLASFPGYARLSASTGPAGS